MKRFKTPITIISTFLATTILWATLYNCYYMNNPIIKKVADAYKVIEENYIFEYDEELVKDVAIAGLVAGLDDPYSQYFPRDYFDSLRESLDGHYFGIGITISYDSEKEKYVINEVNEDGPAHKAGIKTGDYLIGVEGMEVTPDNYEEAIKIIKGDENSAGKAVNITLLNGETGVEYKVSLTREKIINHTVSAEFVEDGIVYIRISKFDNETQSEFFGKLEKLGIDKIKYLILDLRDNGGGTLYSTQTIAEMLMPEAVLTVFEDKQGKKEEHRTTGKQIIKAPICVLVNGGTASASEVLTSGLRDNGRAVVVGEQTFGKAIAQRTIPFETENGETVSALYLTYARYLTPKGEYIHGKGLKPDFVVKTPEQYKDVPVKDWEREQDTQFEKALELARKSLEEGK